MPAITEENRKWWTLGAMCFALFMVMLDNTVVNIALPAIQTRFGATLSNLSWAVNAYTLVFGVLLVTGGRLGDVFGRKRMFLAGIVVFTLGSIGAGLSQSINELIIFRGVQGAGAAFLMPGSLSIITNTFKGPERGRALGLWAGISGLALGMGPVVGGVLVEKAGWEWIFFLNVPVALIAIPVTMYAVQESRDETAARRIDWVGILTLSVGLGALVLGVVQANDYGWTSQRTLGMFTAAAIGLVAFGYSQRRQTEPMLDLNFFRDRNFNAGNVTAFLVTFSMFATFFFVTIYMQRSMGLSPIETGVRFLPMTLLIIVAAPIAGKASDKYGSRWLLATGMTLVAGSLFLESRITDTSGYLTLLPAFIMGGIGIGMTMSPMTALVMGSVDRTKAGAASGVLSMTRMIGGAFGVASLTAVFDQIQGTRTAAGHDPHDAFIYALSNTLLLSAGIALLGAVVAAIFVRTHHAADEVAIPAHQPAAALEPAVAEVAEVAGD
jgi:EmrB/QacA subfamily drug resistance transporter